MALILLKHMLGFSTLWQLAFVLETQAAMVQSKLTTLFVYVMQVPLVHCGGYYKLSDVFTFSKLSNLSHHT